MLSFPFVSLKAENEEISKNLKFKREIGYGAKSVELLVGPKEKDVVDNNGHEQARPFMKSLDASIPISLAINQSLQNRGRLKK